MVKIINSTMYTDLLRLIQKNIFPKLADLIAYFLVLLQRRKDQTDGFQRVGMGTQKPINHRLRTLNDGIPSRQPRKPSEKEISEEFTVIVLAKKTD